MIIEPKDLMIGDIILVPSLMTFKKLRVKRLPSKDIHGYWKSLEMEIWNDNLNGDYVLYNCHKDDFNDIFRFQFDRNMYLIKRENYGN